MAPSSACRTSTQRKRGGPLELAPVAAVQDSYSLLERDAEPILDLPVGFQAFGPLAGGWLTGKYRRGEPPPGGSRMTQRPEPYRHLEADRVHDALDRFGAEARPPASTARPWRSPGSSPTRGIDAVVLGPRRREHLEPALRALELRLEPDERDELASLFA